MDQFIDHDVLGMKFECTPRYQKIRPVGIGGFSLVCAAEDKSTGGQAVAIKKVCKPFQSRVFAKRTFREVLLLRHLRHENLVHLLDIYTSPDDSIYLVTHLMDTDLQKLQSGKPLEAKFAQYFFYQILRGLKYLHSAGIIHRDLKPSNVLVNQHCDIRICDFGLARESSLEMTGYVVTRYYRAPEVMMAARRYDTKVDIWSAGCILAEMLGGTPLFPGKDHIDQFRLIVEFLGCPPDDMLKTSCTDSASTFIKSLPLSKPRSFRDKYLHASPEAIGMLHKVICFDPRKRLDAVAGLEHPYLATYHDPHDEPEADPLPSLRGNKETSVDTWKLMLHSEIVSFHNFSNKIRPLSRPESR